MAKTRICTKYLVPNYSSRCYSFRRWRISVHKECSLNFLHCRSISSLYFRYNDKYHLLTEYTKKNAVLWPALDVAGTTIGGRRESNCSL